ncbi:hypothetical protein LP419_09800 [Massilia sp. H-1]|nr:hypothetical protein LP419_09800 [Massilia sp. H-1]
MSDTPGLWMLAWRRLRADKVAMAALAVVALFLATLLLSQAGLIAADWEDEIALSYAPPAFMACGCGRRPVLKPPRARRPHRMPSIRWPTTSAPSAPSDWPDPRPTPPGAARCRSAPTNGATTSSRKPSRAAKPRSWWGWWRRCSRWAWARCSAPSRATSAASWTTCSTGSTAFSRRSRPS